MTTPLAISQLFCGCFSVTVLPGCIFVGSSLIRHLTPNLASTIQFGPFVYFKGKAVD